MRRLLVLVSVIVFVDTMLFAALIPLFPAYVDEFGLEQAAGGPAGRSLRRRRAGRRHPGGLDRRPHRAEARRHRWARRRSRSQASASRSSASPAALGVARFVQGLASAMTWAGALAWLHRQHRARAARADARHRVRVRRRWDSSSGRLSARSPSDLDRRRLPRRRGRHRRARRSSPTSLRQAAWTCRDSGSSDAPRDPAFLAAIWLDARPALFFGLLDVLVPLSPRRCRLEHGRDRSHLRRCRADRGRRWHPLSEASATGAGASIRSGPLSSCSPPSPSRSQSSPPPCSSHSSSPEPRWPRAVSTRPVSHSSRTGRRRTGCRRRSRSG